MYKSGLQDGVRGVTSTLLSSCQNTPAPVPTPNCQRALGTEKAISCLQWNLSIEDTLNKRHLSNEATVCSPSHIELCTSLPLNNVHRDTSLHRTANWVQITFPTERFSCMLFVSLDLVFDMNFGLHLFSSGYVCFVLICIALGHCWDKN